MIRVDELLERSLVGEWKTTKAPKTGEAGTKAQLARLDLPKAVREIARSVPPSVEGAGGDVALFEAACALAEAAPEDPNVVLAALLQEFNPRCTPAWPLAKLEREAERAAGRTSSPEARLWRRLQARAEVRRNGGKVTRKADDESVLSELEFIDWADPESPIPWICQGLAIAPSERKVTILGGLAGAGKGPFANYLAVCFATGAPVFGKFAVKAGLRVGLLDFEGARLTARRVRSHARGLGIEPKILNGKILLADADPSLMMPGCCGEDGWLRAWVEGGAGTGDGVDVLIVDSYMSAASARGDVDPNSPEWAELARELGSLGIVVIIVAHAKKMGGGVKGERPTLGDIAGSYALGGMAATGVGIYKPDDNDPNLTRLVCMRAPDEAFHTMDVRWTKGGSDLAPEWTAELLEHNAEAVADDLALSLRAAKAAMRVMALHPAHPQTAAVLASQTGVAPRIMAHALGALALGEALAYTPGRSGGAGTYVLGGDFDLEDVDGIAWDGDALRSI